MSPIRPKVSAFPLANFTILTLFVADMTVVSCRRFGLSPFCLSPIRLVAVLTRYPSQLGLALALGLALGLGPIQ